MAADAASGDRVVLGAPLAPVDRTDAKCVFRSILAGGEKIPVSPPAGIGKRGSAGMVGDVEGMTSEGVITLPVPPARLDGESCSGSSWNNRPCLTGDGATKSSSRPFVSAEPLPPREERSSHGLARDTGLSKPARSDAAPDRPDARGSMDADDAGLGGGNSAASADTGQAA